jgi:hypothetical protein
MKLIGILAIVIFLSAGIFVLGTRFFSGAEDTWLCQNSVWVKHGNPGSPASITGCGGGVKSPINGSAENPSALPQSDEIKIVRPLAGEKIVSPVEISGQARGQWFFEASFPIKLVDASGKVVAQGTARAESDWMTTDWVDFIAQLEFARPATETGTLVFQNDNPSGLAQNAKQYSLPIKFNLTAIETKPANLCKVGGCSNQICSDTVVASTCEYSPGYACYKTASCERQPDGRCGWTMTSILAQCLQNARETNQIK